MRDARRDDPRWAEDVPAWRKAYAATPSPEPGECPSEERLAALAVGEVSGEVRTRIADHVIGCPRCADALRTLAELHREALARVRRDRRWRSRSRTWFVAGAAAVLAAVVGVSLFDLPRPLEDRGVVRGPAAGDLRVEPPDGARLEIVPERLSWSDGPDRETRAALHRVVLYDAEVVLLWRSEPTEGRSVQLPPTLRERLVPGVYYWRIWTGAGSERSETPLLRFEIVR